MRTNIDIDDSLMSEALAAGPFKTKKEAVEAGLKLIARQAAARELLKLEGKLQWGWDENEERLDGQSNWAFSAPPLRKSGKVAEKAVSKPVAKPAAKARRVNR